jgi:hypothetical protein
MVVMSLKPGEEIGNEVYPKVDQFFRIEQGEANFVFEGKEKTHRQRWGCSNHPDKTIHKTKAEAEKAEAEEHQ